MVVSQTSDNGEFTHSLNKYSLSACVPGTILCFGNTYMSLCVVGFIEVF